MFGSPGAKISREREIFIFMRDLARRVSSEPPPSFFKGYWGSSATVSRLLLSLPACLRQSVRRCQPVRPSFGFSPTGGMGASPNSVV